MCKDPFLTYLKQFGYSVIRLPRRDFPLLQILAAQGKELQPLGALSTVIVPAAGATQPVITEGPAGAISGQTTSNLSVGVGLSILGSVLGAMGAGPLSLDAAYRSARSIAFEFPAVTAASVAVAELDQLLAASDVNPASRHVATLLEADEVYVVTSTIRSSSISVAARDESGAGVKLAVPEIQKLVGGNVEVSSAGAAASKITYTGPHELVFGFQAVRLYYDEGRYTAFEPLVPGKVAARSLAGHKPLPDGASPWVAPGTFARLGG
jgi:hypothetical protein